jgi:chemotaxis protein CheX
MFNPEVLSATMIQCTKDVFEMMLDLPVAVDSVLHQGGNNSSRESLVVMLGLAGSWAGSATITCTPAFAARMAHRMLAAGDGCEDDKVAIDNETLDAVAEVGNMVIGNVKTEMEAHLGPMGMSIPTVIYGRNFRIRQAGVQEVDVRFSSGEDKFSVYFGLTQSNREQRCSSTQFTVTAL